MRSRSERFLSPLVLLALLVGTALRVFAVFRRPLWADETFTLWLARHGVADIFETLRADSGPPLHYLISWLVLLPFPHPGHGDVAVRLVSLTASLLHFPLLFSVGRRLGDARLGARAAALYALFPLAADFAAEGRAYALASLLALAALDRALAVCEGARVRDAALLALAGAGAALTHYLAAIPVAALALLLPRAPAAAGRRALARGLFGAALLFSPWLLVLVNQPRASMAWTGALARGEAFTRFAANLSLGVDPGGSLVVPLAIGGAALLLVSITRRRGIAGALLLAGIALLFLLEAATGTAILPQRSAMPLLPLTALVLASALPAALLSYGVSVAALAVRLFAPPVVSPGAELARVVLPLAKRGERICAPGLWGPELDYRLAAAGAPGRVVLFPSEVARHRGWFDDAGADPERLRSEARALVAAGPPLFVVPDAGRAADALREELARRPTILIGKSPLFELRALTQRR